MSYSIEASGDYASTSNSRTGTPAPHKNIYDQLGKQLQTNDEEIINMQRNLKQAAASTSSSSSPSSPSNSDRTTCPLVPR